MDTNQGSERDKRESGEPGGGQGRRDEVGKTRIYNRNADDIPGTAEVRMAGSWGGGDYNESGGSELIYRDGIVLGGTTAGPAGEPTIDIHDGRGAPPPEGEAEEARPPSDEDGAEPRAEDRDALRRRGLPLPPA